MTSVVQSKSFSPSVDMSELAVAVLAGGLGTRLRGVVADRPKPLAEIHGRPFLAYLLDQLIDAGIRRVVLCTGYLGEKVFDAFDSSYGVLRLYYSREYEALGTAGALRFGFAATLVRSSFGVEW